MNRSGPLQRRAGLNRSSSLLASGQLSRSTPMRTVSAKRARQNRERAAMIDRLYPGRVAPCAIQVPVPGVCTGWADDIHEPLTRGRGGSITDEDNQVPGCLPCHTYITDTPDSELGWAYERGLLRHSWEVTA